MTAIALLGALMLIAASALYAARRRWPGDDTPLIDALDRALPQTQCAQCGYPGCRPYATALVRDGVPANLCPPGGAATAAHLAELLGHDDPGPPAPEGPPRVARIDEARCIGCFLCIPACPVDAIIGAPGQMHTVLREECTGCELCIAPCPVDCIDMAQRETASGGAA
ncbi:MAG: RnfABCDGE type electron transport complex subunit B [Pseudomonadota bacterium]